MTLLLDFVYLLIFLLGLPYAAYKTLTSERFRAGWGQRFGGVPELEPGFRLWVHCASVGEVRLVRTLVPRLEQAYPQADLVISTNTNTGMETAKRTCPGHTVFYFPLDFSPVVRRVFRKIKPSVVVLVELEVWPNFLALAGRRNVPVVVVNGRITGKSARAYRRLGPVARRMFAALNHAAVQNLEYAARFERLGVPAARVTAAGTMKYDTVATAVAPGVTEEYRRKLKLDSGDTVIIGGCTHPGEDESLIDYVKRRPGAGLRLVLVPRHRERAAEVERLIRSAGLTAVRKTAIDRGEAPADFDRRPHVILVDTTGELANLYAVATLVFVGGSLVEHGGQNMIEPAALGKAVIVGPHTWNFRDTARLLASADGIVRVDNADGLVAALDRLAGDPEARAELGRHARRAVLGAQGATERNVSAIRPVLDAARDRAAENVERKETLDE
ncbi:MAG: glycosyltransferase N-terminal domain-containing protein [Planctomycetota bacterium]